MGRAQRLTAALVLVSLVSVACDATATLPPADETARPSHAGPASPYPTIDVLRPDPNAPNIHARDATAPDRLVGSAHALGLVIDERHSTIAAGFVREVWAYDSTVPGPVIRVRLGDTIRITLDNHPPKLPGAAAWQHPAVNSHPHSVVLGGTLATGTDNTTPTLPGQTNVYEFKAAQPGVWLYHCASEPVLEHLANGEYGMVIVEPEGGLGAADQELFLVEGEWYVGPPNGPASLAKAGAAQPVPDFVAFNGIADQYSRAPIGIEGGKRIRVFVLNAGPNLDTSFHIEGVHLARLTREGIELPVGDDAASQVVSLLPGQGAIVEFTAARSGYVSFVGQPSGTGPSAVGLFQSLDAAAVQ